MYVRGVDFSGAAEPGDDVWLAGGRLDGERLEIAACRPAAEAFGATTREPVLAGLVDLLGDRPATTGVDVSFGLPAGLLPTAVDTWRESIRWFAETFAGADAPTMRERLQAWARDREGGGVELKRRTDDAVGANSPYGFITYYQTLYGIRDVLAPLLEAGTVAVPPMESPGDRTVLETYPAGTLRSLGTVDEKYKEGTPEAVERRETILRRLESESVAGLRVSLDDEVRERALRGTGGDALDSVLAAVATARAVATGFEPRHAYDDREGYIYV